MAVISCHHTAPTDCTPQHLGVRIAHILHRAWSMLPLFFLPAAGLRTAQAAPLLQHCQGPTGVRVCKSVACRGQPRAHLLNSRC